MAGNQKSITDKYEVLEELGKGGMANVFKAVQTSLGRTVAIKEIKPAYTAHPELVERFKREARTSAALVHENIVQVYNFGEPARGSLFIVMEYVDGKDLKTVLVRAGAVPPYPAAIIVLAVARALAYAHARGLVHRDVKPANIMLSRRGEVKLMDFGIVREMDSDLTRTGAFLGTPSYMSPEQLLGEEITPASDVFSLGIVLYEILTGEKPFKADNETSLSKKVRTEKERKVRSINPQVPRRLQNVVHKCLTKNPSKRFDSTDDLCYALEKFLGPRRREDYRITISRWLGEIGEIVEGPSVSRSPDRSAIKLEPLDLEAPPATRETSVPAGPKISEPPRSARRAPPVEGPAPRATRTTPAARDEGPPPETRSRSAKKLVAPKPEAKDARTISLDRPRATDNGQESDTGEWLLKWMWRAILIAIAAIVAVIVFMVFDPLKLSSSPRPPIIEKIIHFFHDEAPPENEEAT